MLNSFPRVITQKLNCCQLDHKSEIHDATLMYISNFQFYCFTVSITIWIFHRDCHMIAGNLQSFYLLLVGSVFRALACILYELFIGEPPFFADGLYRLIDMVVHNPVRWPSEFPPLLRDFLERLLIKDPRTRLTWPALLDHEYIKDLVQGT